MIRVVAFDIGKVLLDFDYDIFLDRVAPRTHLDISALDRLLNQSPLLAEYESGSLDCADFFEEFQKESGYTGTRGEFAALFADIFTPIEEVVALHKQIAVSGLPTYTLSNTNPMAVQHIQQTYSFWPLFTDHVLSYEHGSLKPQSELYYQLEVVSDCSGKEIAYLDDRPENVATGKARGWKAIQFENPDQVQSAFQLMGFSV